MKLSLISQFLHSVHPLLPVFPTYRTPLCAWLLTMIAIVHAPSLHAWSPGTSMPTVTNGFIVDPTNRGDVLSFYNCIYSASANSGANIGWTGSVAGSNPGTTSAAFKNDVLRRVNFYRALVSLPADISFDPVKSAKAQKAALMMARNNALSHFPPTSWASYTADGAEAAGKSNLYLGMNGPAAMDGYMLDPGAGNEIVGHRRWMLYSRSQSMGTGDIPDEGSFRAANDLWVIGDAKSSAPAQFVAWPNRGYCPFPLMPQRWSLSYPGAEFNTATIAMKVGGVSVSTAIISKTDNGYGDNTLVWTASGLPASITADVPCTVTVSGITGSGIPTSYSYSVTLFDPNFLGDAVVIAGPPTPPASGSNYTFNTIQHADAYELRVSQIDSSAWTEGGESSPAPQVVPSITGSYLFLQNTLFRTGAKAFHLATPTLQDQSFTITRDIMPTATSKLEWFDRARFTMPTATLTAEISTDTGATWTNVFNRNGVGYSSSTLWDSTWLSRSVSLASYAGKTVRVRFIMRTPFGSYLPDATTNSGFFIDDIKVTNATQLGSTTTSPLAGNASSFPLNATTAGGALAVGKTYFLRVRPSVGNRWFGDGPLKQVTAAAVVPGYSGWIAANYPDVTGGVNGDHDQDGIPNGVEYAFGLNPKSANASSALPQPVRSGNNYGVTFTSPAGITGVTYGARWSSDLKTWQNITDTGSGNTHIFSVNVTGKPKVFFSHKIVVNP